MNKTKCPDCGKTVYTTKINGVEYGYYERARKTPLIKEIEKLVKIPCYTRETHKCRPLGRVS